VDELDQLKKARRSGENLEKDLARARENVRKTENQAAQDKRAFKETLQQKEADFQVLDFLLSLLGC
jgi:FtsZ-binding cell division protein ZapB